jgi:hypothetical protein
MGSAHRPKAGIAGRFTSLGSIGCSRVPATGPMNSPFGLSLGLSGYWAIAFLHGNGAFSITFTHDGADKRLRLLRRDEVFDDAVRAIPLLAD